MDHEIETEGDHKPSMRLFYQLSPAQIVAAMEYVTNLVLLRKIRQRKSPYGASFFFDKFKVQFRGVFGYRALNRFTKRNNTPLPRIDERFDRLGESQVFSKLEMKTGFHQIRVSPDVLKRLHPTPNARSLNTSLCQWDCATSLSRLKL